MFRGNIDTCGMNEDSSTIDELDRTPLQNIALVINTDKIGTSYVIKRYSKGIYPHCMWFDWILSAIDENMPLAIGFWSNDKP